MKSLPSLLTVLLLGLVTCFWVACSTAPVSAPPSRTTRAVVETISTAQAKANDTVAGALVACSDLLAGLPDGRQKAAVSLFIAEMSTIVGPASVKTSRQYHALATALASPDSKVAAKAQKQVAIIASAAAQIRPQILQLFADYDAAAAHDRAVEEQKIKEAQDSADFRLALLIFALGLACIIAGFLVRGLLASLPLVAALGPRAGNSLIAAGFSVIGVGIAYRWLTAHPVVIGILAAIAIAFVVIAGALLLLNHFNWQVAGQNLTGLKAFVEKLIPALHSASTAASSPAAPGIIARVESDLGAVVDKVETALHLKAVAPAPSAPAAASISAPSPAAVAPAPAASSDPFAVSAK